MKTSSGMKHTGIIAVIMALFLSGCGTRVQTLIYDNPVPENQSATLIIPDGYTVTRFNGTAVNWRYSLGGVSIYTAVATIKLPAGKHNIVYQYYWHIPSRTTYEQHGNVRTQRTTPASTTAFDGNIMLNMDAGKTYIFQRRKIILNTSNQYDKLP